jgi:hypothetical protein
MTRTPAIFGAQTREKITAEPRFAVDFKKKKPKIESVAKPQSA